LPQVPLFRAVAQPKRSCETLTKPPPHEPHLRVERANQTLQDRLVKEMRLRNICSIKEAQAYLPEFILEWSRRFTVEPRDKTPAHRPWTGTEDDLDLALARQEERILSKALTFS
jgi:hypothetical protein